MDWKSQLESLKSSLPQVSPDTEPTVVPDAPAPKPTLTIFFERKGRAGKCATIIAGFPTDTDEAQTIATKLKQHLATGGSVRGGEILLQGDLREKVRTILNNLGYKNVKG